MRCGSCEAKPCSGGCSKKANSGDERRVFEEHTNPARAKKRSARIAELSTQLGYPATGQEIVRRMERMRPTALHAVFVAESEKLVIGWLHASVTPLLEVPLRAEVNGLVVDEKRRSAGWREIIEAAERGRRRKAARACRYDRM